MKVAGTSFRSKAQKPIAEILHLLEDVDLHPKSLHNELKLKLREDESFACVGCKLKLAHIPATSVTPQRPSIILSSGKHGVSNAYFTTCTVFTLKLQTLNSGMYVLLNTDEVVLFLASQGEGGDGETLLFGFSRSNLIPAHLRLLRLHLQKTANKESKHSAQPNKYNTRNHGGSSSSSRSSSSSSCK